MFDLRLDCSQNGLKFQTMYDLVEILWCLTWTQPHGII